MKILITIPHYYNPEDDQHGSGRKDPTPRISGLSSCLLNLYSIFGSSQYMIDLFNLKVIKANADSINDIDVVICTTEDKHLLTNSQIPKNLYQHHQVELEDPKYLGFECQKILRENLGKYDYYCYMEDDLIINDALFFKKLIKFNQTYEYINILQPNRYEVSTRGLVLKSYIDGDISPLVMRHFQDFENSPPLKGNFFEQDIVFKKPSNPHSGCYFLTQKQMEYWVNQPQFLDMDVRFVSPLECSATLGLIKTFNIYKPIPQNANFFEIQHYGDAFLTRIGQEIKMDSEE